MSFSEVNSGNSNLAACVVKVDDCELAISGDMVFSTAVCLRGEGERLIPVMRDHIRVNLSQVGRVGSVGISVLMCWLRMAQVLGKTVEFINVPDEMLDVIRVGGVDNVIPFSS